jgi:hypothetical protein
MTPGQRIRQIQSEERERTVDAITALDADEQVREDIARVFAVVQQARRTASSTRELSRPRLA